MPSYGIWICAFIATGSAIASDLEIRGDVLSMAANAAKASGSIRLFNKGRAPIPISLRASSWDNDLASSVPGPVTVTFAETQGGKGILNYQAKPLPPGGSIELWVEATGLTAPGVSEIALINTAEPVGSIQVLRLDVPFAVRMDPAKPEIMFAGGEPSEIRLVNDDASSYRVQWLLELPDRTYTAGDVIIPAKGVKRITIDTSRQSPFSKSSWALGLLKDDIQDGLLTLTFQPKRGAAPPPGAPIRVTHAQTRFRFYPNVGGVLNSLTLIVFLFLGAAASLILKLWLPNTRRKLKLREDLDRLGRQIADVSVRVGARPTVILRVQQKRLLDLLNPKLSGSRRPLSPDFEDLARQCEISTVRLQKQLELISSLDQSAARVACLMPKPLPPSLLERIETGIDRIVNLALPLEADDQALQALQADVAQITACVQQMEQSNTVFRQDVQRRLADLTTFFNPLLQPLAAVAAQGGTPVAAAPPAPALAADARRIRNDLPSTFEVLAVDDVPEDVSFETLVQIDGDVFKLSLIRRYLHLKPDLSQANPPVNSAAGLYPQLLEYLQLRSWDAMRTTESLVGQAEQALFNVDIENAIRDGRVDIWCDRQAIRPNTPVEFGLRFGREALNQASAREEYRCAWQFEHPAPTTGAPPRVTKLPERCWAVSQYFPSTGQHAVRVTFENWLGQPLVDAQGAAREVTKTFLVERRDSDGGKPRLWLELVSMALALAPALFALLATAQDQVNKVAWYTALGAVFALGFGVDTLKNLVTQKSS